MSEQKSFFSTLPGILTALAGLVTAVAGLILALSQTGLIGSRGKEETKPVAVPPSQPEPAPPKQPLALPPKKSVATAPAQPVRKAPETPQEPTALLETPKLTPQPVTRTPATDGWAIIGFYEQGKFSDLTLMVRGERPVAGQSYEAVKDFRLVLKQRPEKGEKVITLGMVHRG
ncbi:MAG: hypothetical protein HY694_00885, partial [Deltaproteobacteria bacterium]|nr:hypothetical protein [Deltaproteobacteria bacterium]